MIFGASDFRVLPVSPAVTSALNPRIIACFVDVLMAHQSSKITLYVFRFRIKGPYALFFASRAGRFIIARCSRIHFSSTELRGLPSSGGAYAGIRHGHGRLLSILA